MHFPFDQASLLERIRVAFGWAQFGVNLTTTAIQGWIVPPDGYPHHCLIRATAFFLMEMAISIHEERCGPGG
jgi:hypothetical protein